MNKIKNIMNYLDENSKIVAVDKHTYTLDNGDVIEHQFEISDNITVDEFQSLLDKAKQTVNNIIKDMTEA